MNRETERARLTSAGWVALPRGYLPASEVRRIEAAMKRHEAERERILAEAKRPGRKPKP